MIRIVFILLYPCTALRPKKLRIGATRYAVIFVLMQYLTPFLLLLFSLFKPMVINFKIISIVLFALLCLGVVVFIERRIDKNIEGLTYRVSMIHDSLLKVFVAISIVLGGILFMAAGIVILGVNFWN